jgi:hypothetical protein
MSDIEKAILKLRVLYANSNMNTYGEPINLAIEALEKQVPKKPLKLKLHYRYKYDAYPCCSQRTNGYQYDYCPHCGQKLDWSDLNE